MASPYFIVTADGLFEPFGMYVNTADTKLEEMPATREQSFEIPGRDGEIPTEITYAPRLFDFVLRSRDGLSEREKSDLKDLIHAKLNAARARDVELLFHRTRRTYYVRFSGRFDILQEAPNWFECRVPLKAYDPYGYEAYEKKFRGTLNLKNTGNQALDTVVEIAGRVENPSFTADGVYYNFTGTVGEGEKLVLDSRAQNARILRPDGSEAFANDRWCGRFLTLPPGQTRILADFNVNIKYANKWI